MLENVRWKFYWLTENYHILNATQGLTWDECHERCPEGVVPACHNAPGTVTISGPIDKVHNFVQTLKDEGIFAKELNSSGVAFHSYIMEACAPSLNAALKKVR